MQHAQIKGEFVRTRTSGIRVGKGWSATNPNLSGSWVLWLMESGIPYKHCILQSRRLWNIDGKSNTGKVQGPPQGAIIVSIWYLRQLSSNLFDSDSTYVAYKGKSAVLKVWPSICQWPAQANILLKVESGAPILCMYEFGKLYEAKILHIAGKWLRGRAKRWSHCCSCLVKKFQEKEIPGGRWGEVSSTTLPSLTSEGDSACESEQEFSSISSLVGTKLSPSEADLSWPSIDVA